MQASIPKLREAIKDAAMTELKDFLENIRKYSPKIGEMAMRNTAAKLNIEHSGDDREISLKKKHLQLAPQPNPMTGEVDYEGQSESTFETEEDLCAQDLVDFSPVYRGLHIFSVLGERDKFEKYYRKQRRDQAMLALQPPTNMHESMDSYRHYFHGKVILILYSLPKPYICMAPWTISGVVGFFVCEDHVLNTGNGLVTRSYLDDLWSTTSTRVLSTLQAHSAFCTESSFMLKIKNLMLLFSSTLQNYGFSGDKMYALLQELRDHYTEVLMQKWVIKFRDIFEIDNYHPLEVGLSSDI